MHKANPLQGYHIEEVGEALDAVCGMELAIEDTDFSSEHNGSIYYFCSENCKEHFDANPERYVND